MSEWKPGDVFISAGMRVMFTDGNGGPQWHFADGSSCAADINVGVRPLVVIDPDADVQRLADLFKNAVDPLALDNTHSDWAWDSIGKSLSDALREFAAPTPAKPEEPLGLGAVVVDEDGEHLVRVPLASNEERWFCRESGEWHRWSDLRAVTVLSEGVPNV